MGEKLFEYVGPLYVPLLIACVMIVTALLCRGWAYLFRKMPARLPSSKLMPPNLSQGDRLEEDRFRVPDGRYSIHAGKSRLAGRGRRGA